MNIIDTLWFTTAKGETIGIVLGHDEISDEPKAYIGVDDGIDPEVDTKTIASLGGKFHPSHLQMLTNHFSPESDLERDRRTAG